MKRFLILALPLFLFFPGFSQDRGPHTPFGLSVGVNYTFSGLSLLLNVEYQNADHIFYTGPRLPISRSYIPLKNPWGWNIGYRHEYMKSQEKVASFFFNIDYQIAFSEAFSHVKESNKLNYVHELFVGYGVQFKFSPRVYLANVLGVGGHMESYYNVDLDERHKFFGYNNLLKFFFNYKF